MTTKKAPAAKQAASKPGAAPRTSVSRGAAQLQQDGTIHEVTVTEPGGHQTVHRVAATSKDEAERIVSERLGEPGQRTLDVAGPRDLVARERRHEREVTQRHAAARDEAAGRDG